ncbi:ATP synthase F0 subunit B [Vagococcus penaei]|uniref:ATP synthase subunit b n=1 Tax=Vagococcus penaei TaxID=633807 RepID=A0A1Q2D4P9_9ENTE|nr:F0F1 ATP synthase subunit B [Vagococcus penaei]AQP53319.1 ATP synthase F0 subunit B [Vagococcus penaei]RSU04089.1 ATP synthase F0 subunit B [Vagococcus penaei]
MNNSLIVASSGQTTLSTILFVIVSFIILLLALKKFAWGPVVNMMQERQDKIANDIDNAEKSRNEASSLLQQREDDLRKARTEAQGIIAQAKETAENSAHAILIDAEKHAKQMKKQAEEDIKNERNRMLEDAKHEIADLSIEIASKILKKELSPETHQDLIKSSIEKLGVIEDD